LDYSLFWKATDLELKLSEFKDYFNKYRVHAALKGQTPIETPISKIANRNCIAGRNMGGGYTKPQLRPEDEFATDKCPQLPVSERLFRVDSVLCCA
jgi:hypothetical protein